MGHNRAYMIDLLRWSGIARRIAELTRGARFREGISLGLIIWLRALPGFIDIVSNV